MTRSSPDSAAENAAQDSPDSAGGRTGSAATVPRRSYRRPARRFYMALACVALAPSCSLFHPPVPSVGTAHDSVHARAVSLSREQGQALAQRLVQDYRSQATALLPVLATQQLDAVTALLVEWYDVMTDVFPTSQTVWADGMPRLHDVRQRARFGYESLLRGSVWEHGLPAQVAAATASLMDTLTQYELDRESLGSLPPERWLELRDAYNGWIVVLTTLAQAATQDPVRAWLGEGAESLAPEPERGGSEAAQSVLPDEL